LKHIVERAFWALGIVFFLFLVIRTSHGVSSDDSVIEIRIWEEARSVSENRIQGILYRGFEKEHSSIRLKRMPRPGTRTDDRVAFTIAMAGGTAPDCHDAAHFSLIPIYIDQNFCLDLTPYVKSEPQYSHLVDSFVNVASRNGRIYGIPHIAYVMSLAYRKDLFAESGLDPNKPPQNWDEFSEYAVKLTDRNSSSKRYGFAVLGMDFASWHWENYVWQAGGEVTEQMPDGTCKIRFTEEAGIKALQYYKDLRWKWNCIQPNPLQSYDDNIRDFKNGRVAMILIPAIHLYQFEILKFLKPEQIGFAPLPAGPTGKRAAQIGGAFYIINPNIPKERQDACFKFIKYMTSPETIRKRWLLLREAKIIYPNISIYKNLAFEDIIQEVPAEWGRALTESVKEGRAEYFLKDHLDILISRAIQRVLTDQDADPKKVLEECAIKAHKEIVDRYNAKVRAK
jgi:ABC-type glycerol-3-phosphate transport system substrate-binding protein